MNDVLFVRRCQGSRRLFTESRRFNRRRTDARLDVAMKQRLAFQKLHDDVQRPVGFLAKLEDLDETRMANDVHRARFVEKPLGVLVVFCVFGVHHLDGGTSTDGVMLGFVDNAHSALAKLA